MKKDKILVIFTGGTIGSVKVKNVILQPSEAIKRGLLKSNDVSNSSLLLNTLKKQRKEQEYNLDRFEVINAMEVLSENMSIDYYNKLLRFLAKLKLEEYKGVIITHGTDTLGYTANLIGMMLNEVTVPVMLVSSDYVVSDSRANGIKNFVNAVNYIDSENALPGVYVSYSKNGLDKIIYGTRAMQCGSVVDDIYGISNKSKQSYLGTMSGKDFRVYDEELYKKIKGKKEYRISNLQSFVTSSTLRPNVRVVKPAPGLDYDSLRLETGTAILHPLYHSGTACADGSYSQNIIDFSKKCEDNGCELVVGPLYGTSNKSLYGSTEAFKGCNFVMNTSEENAYIKLLIAKALYSQSRDVYKYLMTEYNNEFINKYKTLKK